MNPVTLDQVLPYQQWERLRPVLRPLFILEKGRLRLALGDHLTLLFENTQTVWYQIEEMLRVEKITDPHLVQHEISTYNELLPAAGELSATMFVEYTDAVERDSALRRLVGLERHVALHLGERTIGAAFDGRQMDEQQVSAVQFVRFGGIGDPAAFVALAEAGQVYFAVDHPALQCRAAVDGPFARALTATL